MAATGGDEKTKPAVADVAEHAHGLLQTNLQTMAARVADVRRSANATNTSYQQQRTAAGGYNNVPVVTKAGLTQSNVSELRTIKDTCQKIGPAAEAFAKSSADAGGGAAAWDTLSADAGRTASQVDDVLGADYGSGATPLRRR